MKISEAINQLKVLAKLVENEDEPWLEEPKFTDAPITSQLNEFEKVSGFQIKGELLEFFTLNDSIIAMSIHNGYWIGGINQLKNIYTSGNVTRKIKQETCIPLATDGSGNTFIFTEAESVWKVDHETLKETLISNSLSEFFERVIEDWKAFVEQKENWTYLV